MIKAVPFFRAGFAVASALVAAWASAAGITITVLHTNDLHAHVESVTIKGKQYGGYARLASAILEQRAASENPLLIDAGDVFQGTLYFNVYEGLADLSFLNLMGYRAMAVGNHEFDRGPQPLATFAKMANFPLVAANLDVSQEPLLKDLVKPSVVTEVGGEKIGIVGVTTPDLPTISAMGPTVRMKELVKSVQTAVDDLTKQGVDKIILLSHCGFGVDLQTAREVRNVDMIVGGHSHTLLGDVKIEGVTPSGNPYPTIVKDAAGQDILVVQAWEWGKVLGKIRLTFDDKGKVTDWSKDGPIVIDESLPENPFVAQIIAAFQRPILALQTQKVGESQSNLTRDPVDNGDSTMGNVVADAMLELTASQDVVAAFMNAGGVRRGLEAGPITYGQAIEVQPFGNTLILIDVTGAELKAALEHGASRFPEFSGGTLYPSRGTSYVVDATQPVGSRVVQIVVAGQPWSAEKTYRICVNSFTAGGGDDHATLKSAPGRRVDTGFIDVDALIEYLKKHNPVTMQNENRLTVKK